MSNEMNVIMIPVNRIETDGQMVRAGMDDDHVIELSNSIAKLGLLEPIVVSVSTDNRFQLIAGAHRLMACKRLNWETIPANVRTSGTDESVRGLALVENIIRRDMSIEEECNAIKILSEQEKMSISQICQLLGRSRNWVLQRFTAHNLPELIRSALFDNLISIAVAETIASLDGEGAQNYILNEAIYAKRTLHEIRSMVETYKAVPDMEEAIEHGIKKAKEIQATKAPRKACEYNGELTKIHEMKLLWLCTDCYNDILSIKEIANNIHTEGDTNYGHSGEGRN